MKRIWVLGGFGFFGGAAVKRLRADGAEPLIASRRTPADAQVDVEDPLSIRRAFAPDDVVIDTIGPFQERTTALVEAAIEVGFDVVDIADSVSYVQKIYGLAGRIQESGIRVLTACSSISAVSAALIRHESIEDPVRVTGLLAPASRYVASPATGGSLLRSVGRTIQVLQGGSLVERKGWGDSFSLTLPSPIGRIRGHLFESADAITLPKIWPTLRTVDFYVHSHVPGYDSILKLAASRPAVWRLIHRLRAVGFALARFVGSAHGALAYEVEGPDKELHCFALIAREQGYYTPIVPAVIAARSIAAGQFMPRGLVPADQQVDSTELIEYLDALGIEYVRLSD